MKQRVAYNTSTEAFEAIAPDGSATVITTEGGVDDAAVLAVIRDGIDADKDTLAKLYAALVALIGAPVLQSPDGTNWALSVGDDGALTTTQVA